MGDIEVVKRMKATEVFTPGKTPSVTLVDDHLVKRREVFNDALAQGGMLVTISGPSKSGKTVFVKNTVGANNIIAITGAGVTSPDELWTRVFHQIGTPLPGTKSSEASSGTSVTGALKATGSVFFAKAEAGGSYADNLGTKSTATSSAATDYLQLLIQELSGSDFVLFIDDFHYMSRETQGEVARQIKEAIDKGVTIVCASVPYRSEDVLRANSDLRGRLVSIDFDYWSADVLAKIAEKGFAELNVVADGAAIGALAAEAAGSPQLMQALCLNACFEAGFREAAETPQNLPGDENFFHGICVRTVGNADYSGTLEKLKEGPKTRGTPRQQYRLHGGSVGDVYTIILRAIALSPPTLHFRYSELLDRIKRNCENESPVGSSVTGACLQIALLANDGQQRDIVEWDGAEDVLDIRDPYLLFFMRWSDALGNGDIKKL